MYLNTQEVYRLNCFQACTVTIAKYHTIGIAGVIAIATDCNISLHQDRYLQEQQSHPMKMQKK